MSSVGVPGPLRCDDELEAVAAHTEAFLKVPKHPR